jgi:long-chain acyl-CoA synthetase
VPSQKALLVLDGATLTYGAALDRMARLYSFFAEAKLQPGDRVMIVSRDDAAVVVLFLAALRAGLTAIVGDRDMPVDEFARLCEAADPHTVFLDELLAEALRREAVPVKAPLFAIPAEEVLIEVGAGRRAEALPLATLLEACEPRGAPPVMGDDGVGLIIFTSGTTSQPKGVQLTHGNLRAQHQTFSRVYGFDDDSRIFNLLPVHHVDGLIRGPLAAFLAGGTVHRVERFRAQLLPSILSDIRAKDITHFVAVPSLLALILRLAGNQRDCFRGKDFRHVISSADLLDVTLWSAFEDRFGVIVVNAYGLSETVCDALFCGPDDTTRRVGTIGKPVGCEARVVNDANAEVEPGEVGELLIRGPIVTKGYFRQPEATAQVLVDGWFHTGDLVRTIDQGFYEFVGRKKNIIKSRGINIHPENVTSAIRKMPGVTDAITLGLADEVRGQLVVACVVVEKDSTIDGFAVLDHCKRTLPPEKQPSHALIVNELPRGPAGKFILSEAERIAREQLSHAEHNVSAQDVYSIATACLRTPRSALSPQSNPFNTEGWDSIAHLELILALEKAFRITFSPSDILNLESLADAERIVSSHLRSRPNLSTDQVSPSTRA